MAVEERGTAGGLYILCGPGGDGKVVSMVFMVIAVVIITAVLYIWYSDCIVRSDGLGDKLIVW